MNNLIKFRDAIQVRCEKSSFKRLIELLPHQHCLSNWLCAVLLSLGTFAARADEPLTTLIFATYPSERPSEELVKLEPVRSAIEQSLNAKGSKYRVEMRIFTTYAEAIDASVTGKADFARLGPASYVHAKKKNSHLRLLAMESKGGSGFLTGYIFVADDSPIHELKDLRGVRFAFGEENSTTGSYLPQAAMVKTGLRAKDLAEYKYLGRHDKVAFAVGIGSFDAGASNEITYGKYAAAKSLRAIFSMKGRTHAWVARANLPAPIRRQLQTALLELKSEDLARLGRDGFLPAQDSDYDEIRSAMKQAERFSE